MVIALVGRRIDSPDARLAVFPLANVGRVGEDLRRLLGDRGAAEVVCSAACGADLLALEAAGDAGLRRRIVLPFETGLFRETSVVDRPGNWGPLFDKTIAEVRAKGDLVELQLPPDDDDSYLRANDRILTEALSLAAAMNEKAAAVLVWNGVAREGKDITAAFGDAARARELDVFEVRTL